MSTVATALVKVADNPDAADAARYRALRKHRLSWFPYLFWYPDKPEWAGKMAIKIPATAREGDQAVDQMISRLEQEAP